MYHDHHPYFLPMRMSSVCLVNHCAYGCMSLPPSFRSFRQWGTFEADPNARHVGGSRHRHPLAFSVRLPVINCGQGVSLPSASSESDSLHISSSAQIHQMIRISPPNTITLCHQSSVCSWHALPARTSYRTAWLQHKGSFGQPPPMLLALGNTKSTSARTQVPA